MAGIRAGLIVNPASGTDRALDLLPRITGRLRDRFADLQITVTAGADDARLAATRAVEAGCAALYVAGGDGTLNAALSGMADSPEARYVPIGIIPLGTGNDFSKALDLGEDAEGALDLLMEPLAIDVDLGLMNERPFINASAGGFVAEVSDAVTPAMKDIAGKLAYLIGGARALMTTTALRMRLSVSSDGAAAMPAGESVIQMFAVCNARFIGGGYAIAPAALIDDGLLDVLVVPQMSWLDFVGVLQQLASTGDPGRDDVLHFRGSAFEFEFDRDALVNVDGEVLSARHCRYGVRHRSVRFFCGPKPHAAASPQSHSWKTQ